MDYIYFSLQYCHHPHVLYLYVLEYYVEVEDGFVL